MPSRGDAHETITVYISVEGLALLRQHNFPCSDVVLATATATKDGIRLTGMRFEIESLAGWVAGEANDSRKKRRTRKTCILDEVADELETALVHGSGGFLF
ncbi:MAG: hypothetical protein JXB39_03740 [Deltaproteobacteria bacterium]|nr:hypothetical protein [Deltaproteobacteria bacterium]